VRVHRGAPLVVTVVFVALPPACGRGEVEGEVTDAQGCRTIVLPESDGGALCGDALVEGEEECDEGELNGSAISSCLGDCRANRCGDGFVGGGEECDEGDDENQDDGACMAGCVLAECGDGVVNAPMGVLEECDEGAENRDGGVCMEGCVLAECGDGVVNAPMGVLEECDEGAENADDRACTMACAVNVCGDGKLHEGVEGCDDGNVDGRDGCSAACVEEVVRVFVTSGTFSGALGGLKGADEKCAFSASVADLPGKYMAWLSDSEASPATRFGLDEGFVGRFVLVNGATVAFGWEDLVDGSLVTGIVLDQFGNVSDGSAWTGTLADGSSDLGSGTCSSWTSASQSDNARVGLVGATTTSWSRWAGKLCANTGRLYCFQVEF
jgi:cysteine-rich repeat protein